MMGGTSEPGGFSRVMPTQAQGPARWPKFLKICKIQIWSKMHPEVQKSTLIMIFDNLDVGFSVLKHKCQNKEKWLFQKNLLSIEIFINKKVRK